MKKIFLLVGLTFLFSACSNSIPTVTKYKLFSNLNVTKEDTSNCKSKNVKVSSAFTSSSLMSKDMSYVHGNSKVFKYSESAWLNNPNRSVSRELIKMLRDTGIFKSVQESKSRSIGDLIIETTLEDFMQYYSNDLKSSYVLVQINYAIIDSKTNKIVFSKTFKAKADAKTLDAKGGVDALNIALKSVLKDSSSWFVEACK